MFYKNPILKKRLHAFTFDMFLIVGINYFLMASFTDFLKIVFFHFPIHTQIELIHKFKYINSLSILSVMFAYFSIFYYATNGQTMGKMIFGLRVKTSEATMGLTVSMIRSFSYLICAWMGSLPFIIPYFRQDHRGVPDFLSKSSVYFEEEEISSNEVQMNLFDYVEQAHSVSSINHNEETEYTEQNKAA